MSKPIWMIPAVIALLCASCTPPPEPREMHGGGEAPTNRIDIPDAVVQNLGITFATVERRRVEQTLRLAGAFESPPEAQRDYSAPLAGRVALHVSEYGSVDAGELIATIDSPGWREIQRGLAAAEAAIAEHEAIKTEAEARAAAAESALALYPRRVAAFAPQLKAAEEHSRRLEAARDGWQARVSELVDLVAAGAGRAGELAEARAQLAGAAAAISAEAGKVAELRHAIEELNVEREQAGAELPVIKAAVQVSQARAAAAEAAFQAALRSAETAVGAAPRSMADGSWRELQQVEVRANSGGTIVDLQVREGAWVEPGAPICRALDASRLRFRARGFQSDLAKLRDGLLGRVIAEGVDEVAEGEVRLAPTADASARLIDVLLDLPQAPAWARPGVSAQLEVVWDETAKPELAVPARAVVRDGLEHVLFVRESPGAAKVIRMETTVGPSDGRWIVVYSGPMKGDEVVVDGAYELNLAGAGSAGGGGHFHADGTWHADDH